MPPAQLEQTGAPSLENSPPLHGEQKALPLLDKLNKKGSAVVVAGSKDACDKAAVQFEEIGLKTEVRPLEAADVPSEYDDSDVVVGGAKELNDALKEGNPVLVVFHAPWCGHCKTMVPAVKEAATTLKAEVPDTTVMAIDGQVSPAVVRQLGVQAYPSVLWLQLGDQLMLAEHGVQLPHEFTLLIKTAVFACSYLALYRTPTELRVLAADLSTAAAAYAVSTNE